MPTLEQMQPLAPELMQQLAPQHLDACRASQQQPGTDKDDFAQRICIRVLANLQTCHCQKMYKSRQEDELLNTLSNQLKKYSFVLQYYKTYVLVQLLELVQVLELERLVHKSNLKENSKDTDTVRPNICMFDHSRILSFRFLANCRTQMGQALLTMENR